MNGIKPPYKVPSMEEIRALPWNGYNVVSTFSGGGGSCLGYEMAGFHVIWANEFVEEAQKTYRLNHTDTYLDCRDIRQIKPEDILKQTGLNVGEIDLFDGSPPCCAFSTAGKREKGWNQKRSYSDGKVQQIENLFYEYIRILDGLKPKTFIAENVSGMVKGKAFGYFKEYIGLMKAAGYNVRAQLLNSKWLGVPQARERIIFIGVRNDLNIPPVFPHPLKYTYSIRDGFSGLKNNPDEVKYLIETASKYAWGKIAKKIPKDPAKPISGETITGHGYFNLVRDSFYLPCSTLCQSHGGLSVCGSVHPLEDRKYTIAEIKRLTSVPDDFVLTGTYSQKYERLARMVPPLMMKRIAECVKVNILDKISEGI